MDIKEIKELVQILNKSNLGEIRLEQGDFKITLRTKDYMSPNKSELPAQIAIPMQPAPIQQMPVSVPAPPPPAAAEAKTDTTKSDDSKYITIKSPMIGTFYRTPAPDKEPFVKPGDTIKQGTVVCVIEAMKLFNEIESEVSGKIVKILVENATPVEYDQPLFLVEPS